MLIAVLISLAAAFNLVILYQYILVKRQKTLAVFQICGCTKGYAVRMYLAESLLMTVPCYILTALLYHFALLPMLMRVFPYIDTAYSLQLYTAAFAIFIGICTVGMALLSEYTVRKSSIVQRKGGGAA